MARIFEILSEGLREPLPHLVSAVPANADEELGGHICRLALALVEAFLSQGSQMGELRVQVMFLDLRHEEVAESCQIWKHQQHWESLCLLKRLRKVAMRSYSSARKEKDYHELQSIKKETMMQSSQWMQKHGDQSCFGGPGEHVVVVLSVWVV